MDPDDLGTVRGPGSAPEDRPAVGGVVVHGLLILSWLAQQASAFGAGPAPIAMIKVRFRSALAPAEAARIEASVTKIAPDGQDASLSLKVVANNVDVVTGSAVVNLAGVTR